MFCALSAVDAVLYRSMKALSKVIDVMSKSITKMSIAANPQWKPIYIHHGTKEGLVPSIIVKQSPALKSQLNPSLHVDAVRTKGNIHLIMTSNLS